MNAVETRVVDRRGADPDVHLGRAGATEHGDDLRGRIAAHDRVVDDR